MKFSKNQVLCARCHFGGDTSSLGWTTKSSISKGWQREIVRCRISRKETNMRFFRSRWSVFVGDGEFIQGEYTWFTKFKNHNLVKFFGLLKHFNYECFKVRIVHFNDENAIFFHWMPSKKGPPISNKITITRKNGSINNELLAIFIQKYQNPLS